MTSFEVMREIARLCEKMLEIADVFEEVIANSEANADPGEPSEIPGAAAHVNPDLEGQSHQQQEHAHKQQGKQSHQQQEHADCTATPQTITRTQVRPQSPRWP